MQLLARLRFKPDRDQLVFVGDLVNRGPLSVEVLRFVKSLGAGAQCVLGNHDLHLLAHYHDPGRKLHRGDTLQSVLEAPDGKALAEWLLTLPLAIHDVARNELVVHAGLVPQWSAAEAAAHGARASSALREDPAKFLDSMYGNDPDTWDDDLKRKERLRFTINVLTRMRYCTAEGRVNLKLKGPPDEAQAPYAPWFSHAGRRSAGTRVIFGHWSTLGLLRRNKLLALDTGCVWGGALTAVDLDDPESTPVSHTCRAHQQSGGD